MIFGDLQLVPIADGLLYIRPVYVVASNDVTEFRYVIVSTGNDAVIGDDLESALAQLFPGFDVPIGDRVPDGNDNPDDPATGEPDETTTDDTSDAPATKPPTRPTRATTPRRTTRATSMAGPASARRRASCSTRQRSCSRRPSST